ncbi:NADH-cytochrome b5 reductase [Actinomortierella ambigua]|uniref:NADH-cytochrome b5 reductase n=1 Tax=Actinomortierella ambigua TaxID=1343610 RepID=A0A9P6U5V0_9FUNG|nr:NADH-cytochrome b5 reductase [Actinomortierella ambigua]
MALSNPVVAALSGALLVGSYLYDPTTLPVAAAGVAAAWAAQLTTGGSRRAPPMDPKEYRKFTLVDKVPVSPNTAMYKFALPHKDDKLNLPIGQHISVMANINGKEVSRSYTPTSSSDDIGHFVLLIKSYPQGNISKLFGELSIGDNISVRGPKGQFNYTANMCRHIGMIAGGTGITPMLQIIRAVVKNPEDKTQLSLIFANVTEEDILLRAELEALAKKHPQLKVTYCLNTPPEGWTGYTGFVTADMIKEHMPKPADDIKILLCGPTPMVSAMAKHTLDLGYQKANAISKLPDQVFKF